MIIGESEEISVNAPPTNVAYNGTNQGVAALSVANNKTSKNIKTSSFLTGQSQISSNVILTNNTAKDKKYSIKHPLVIIFGIGDYDNDVMPSLIGVSQDYINCIATFLKLGYCIFYQNTQNSIEYIDRYNNNNTNSTKINLKQCKENVKLHWDEEEIGQFFTNAREYVLKNKHDSCIFLLSSHGESDGIIIDSTGEEISLLSLFCRFDGTECQYLVDKPKMIFVDACRGRARSKPIAPIKLNINSGEKKEQEKEEKENEKDKVNCITKSDNAIQSNTNDSVIPQRKQATNTNDNNNDRDDWYHSQENFIHIYSNPEGYAAADGGTKGGYLIRSVKRVFSNLEVSLNQTLNDIIVQIRAEAKEMAGKGALECVQVVDTMTSKIVFEKRKCLT